MYKYVIVSYFIINLLIGFFSKNKYNDAPNYFFLSRKLTLPGFIASIVSTWYGGILAVGNFTYHNGLVTWIIFGLVYYIAAIIFLLFISSKIYQNNIQSIPEYFYKSSGSKASLITSVIILFISSPAPYILILMTLLEFIFDISYITSLLISLSVSIIYIFRGGFSAIVNTDKLQFILMYAGFIIMIILLYNQFGGFNFIKHNVPSNHLLLSGNLDFSYIISWFFIAMITFIDPNIFQRIYSANNKQTITKGLILSIICWFIFDCLTILTGLYASAIIPINDLIYNPYLQLADIVMPDFLKALFFISLLSIVMSTIDSFTFISSMTIGKDLLKSIHLSNKNNLIRQTQAGIVVTCLISCILVLHFKSAIEIWYISGSFAASSILIPFIILINNKKIKYIEYSIGIPLIISIMVYIANIPIEPLYPGLFVSGVLCYFNLEDKDS